MLARTMWLERGMWVSCRRERGSISPNCNKLDFGGVVQLNFVAAINVAAIYNDDSRQMPAMFLWYLPIAIQQLFRSATRVQGFQLPIVYDEKSGDRDATSASSTK